MQSRHPLLCLLRCLTGFHVSRLTLVTDILPAPTHREVVDGQAGRLTGQAGHGVAFLIDLSPYKEAFVPPQPTMLAA
jgi:hypothetical protein